MKVEQLALPSFSLPIKIKNIGVPEVDMIHDIRHTSDGIRGTVEIQSEANMTPDEQFAALIDTLEELTGKSKISVPRKQ